MKRFFLRGGIILLLLICETAFAQALSAQEWRRQAAAERFMAETPQTFIFSCNFINKNSVLLRKIEVKISSPLYLSQIIPAPSIDINAEDLTQHSAESLCAETWAVRVKNDALDYFKGLRSDLSGQVTARSRLLQQISAAEKQALYAEEEKRIERIKEQIQTVDRVVAQLQAP